MHPHRLFLCSFALYVLLCTVGTLLYFWAGRDFIATSYHEGSAGVLAQYLKNRDSQSLEYYNQRAENIIIGF